MNKCRSVCKLCKLYAVRAQGVSVGRPTALEVTEAYSICDMWVVKMMNSRDVIVAGSVNLTQK